MARRWVGPGLVVVLAATVVAVVAATSTYGIAADTGRHPVVFANEGRGPAVVLRNRPAYPPLAVTSSTKVAHLNADLVDGMDATDLEPATMRWAFGKNADPLRFYEELPVAPGWYAVNGHVAVKSSDDVEHTAGCYAFPRHQGNGGDYSNVVSGQARVRHASYLSVSGVIQVPRDDSIEFACQVDDGGAMNLLSPATFVARPIDVVDGPPAVDLGPMRPSAAITPPGGLP